MSPSENDLRAALRDGEGDDRPDVDGLLAHVRGRRTQRRTRVLSTAAAVVVVAAAATGGAVLWGGSGGHGQQAGQTAGHSPAVGSRTPSTPFSSQAATESPGCPSSYPSQAAPAGPGTNGLMFPDPVASVTICAYSGTGAMTLIPTSAPLVLTGSEAAVLTASIERASTTKLHVVCPDIASEQRTELAIIGVTASDLQLPTVTTNVSIPNCNQPITNGTAVRYAWKPPADLAGRITALTARGNVGTGSTTPGTVTGPSTGSTSGLPSMSTTSGKIGTPVR